MSFGYDWASRPASVTSTAYSGTLAYGYGLDGLLTSRDLPSAGTDTISYDAAKRPIGVSRSVGGDSLGRTYDRAGDVTSDSRAFSGLPSGDAAGNTQTFTYDGLHRVTGSSGLASASYAYTYDLDGNRLTATTTVGGTPTTRTDAYDRTDELTSQTIDGGVAVAFAYDASGELTTKVESDGTTSGLQYDTAGRLVVIDRPATSDDPAFTYDALGRVATRTIAGATEAYAYLGTSDTVGQVAGTTTTDALLGPSGERLAVTVGSTLDWTLFDAHGDLVGLLDAAGSIARSIRYDPYGEIVATYSGGLASPWRYQGALDLNDGASPLYALGARTYAPSLGAWTQADSLAGSPVDPPSMNRFLYAEANPTTLVDPTGRYAQVGEDICPACTPASSVRSTAATSGVTIVYKPIARRPANPRLATSDIDLYNVARASSGSTMTAVHQIQSAVVPSELPSWWLVDSKGVAYDPYGTLPDGYDFPFLCVGVPDVVGCVRNNREFNASIDPNGWLIVAGGSLLLVTSPIWGPPVASAAMTAGTVLSTAMGTACLAVNCVDKARVAGSVVMGLSGSDPAMPEPATALAAGRYLEKDVGAPTTLFRAVGPNELADLRMVGRYRLVPGGVEGKYFFSAPEQTSAFARMMGDKPYTTTSVGVSPYELAKGNPINPAGEGPGYFFRTPDIPSGSVTIHDHMVLP